MKTFLVVLALAALGLAACGDSDEESADAFCSTLLEVSDDFLNDDFDAVAGFQAIADAAPGEIKSDAQNMADKWQEFFDFTDEQKAQENVEWNESMDASADAVEVFATNNCSNLPADFFS